MVATSPPRSCNSCGRQHPLELEMTVNSGSVLTLLSCNGCEHRTWLLNSETAGVGAVLAAAAGDDAFVLAPSRGIGRKRVALAQPAPHR